MTRLFGLPGTVMAAEAPDGDWEPAVQGINFILNLKNLYVPSGYFSSVLN